MKIHDAAEVVRSDRSAHEIASADQEAAEWREAFEKLGLDLRDPLVAAGAFALGQILHWHLTQAVSEPETALYTVGQAITHAVVASAEFVG